MARRKPGRGGGERGKRGVARAALPRQRRVPAKCARPVAVTARSPGRVSAPPFNPRAAAAAAGGGGNNNSQPPAANAAVASQPAARTRELPAGDGQAGQEGGSRALLTPATAPLPLRPPALSGAGGERGASATRLLAGRRAGCGRRCRRGGREGGGRAAERRFLCAVPARGGIRRTGRRRGCGGGGAAATRGGGGGAGSSRVPASQEWEASEAKMPPGCAAPLGRPGISTLAAPPWPSPPPRSLPGTSGRSQGLWHLRIRHAGLTNLLPSRSDGQQEECCQREDEPWMVMPATYG
ncbi:translation initiation factor IF-2-like [Motacilla alba alba]|uniref:translation initiation factor IF-2-like n=1 Tax=Motacilla alba alba TaxID=1094192 RepID=UPI0018D59788|nr:translation initiation factor IF-2-like [Motacilla alba alba]